MSLRLLLTGLRPHRGGRSHRRLRDEGGSFASQSDEPCGRWSNADRALVLNPTAPRARWLLFHFANQRF